MKDILDLILDFFPDFLFFKFFGKLAGDLQDL